MRSFLLILLTILLVNFVTACGNKKATEETKIVKFNLQSNPPQLDPQLSTDSISGDVLGHVLEGLTTLSQEGNPIPGAAESWTTKGNVWTFKLRKNAKWQNGDTVVAGDFLAAWERALNPETVSQYSYIMYSIKGAEDYNQGKTNDFSTVGVKAPDDYTLIVELKEPVAYFASLVSFYTFVPQNQNFFKEHKETYATSVDDFMGNGPYKLVSWDSESKIILEKANTYWNNKNIKINRIEMSIISDISASLKAYRNDELDWSPLPPEEIIKYKDSPDFTSWEDGSISYFQFNISKKLFSNKKIRRAISMAIDRKTLVNKVKYGAGSVAESFVPGIIPGKKKTFREDYLQSAYGIGYNPEEAKKLFSEGLAELGIKVSDIGEISMLTENNDVSIRESQFYQEQLKVNLGLEVQLEPVTFQVKIQRISEKDFDFVLSGWGPDYNDPMTFLDLWLSTSLENNTNWASPEYDKIINNANKELNPLKRMDLLASAEKLLMKEMPVVPIFYKKRVALIKPKLKNVINRALSPDTDFRFSDIKK